MTSQGMTAAEFSFFRSFFNLLFSSVLLRMKAVHITEGITRKHLPALLIRCGIGAINFIIVLYVIKLLPLTIYFMISQMAPFLTALLAWLWLGEAIT